MSWLLLRLILSRTVHLVGLICETVHKLNLHVHLELLDRNSRTTLQMTLSICVEIV